MLTKEELIKKYPDVLTYSDSFPSHCPQCGRLWKNDVKWGGSLEGKKGKLKVMKVYCGVCKYSTSDRAKELLLDLINPCCDVMRDRIEYDDVYIEEKDVIGSDKHSCEGGISGIKYCWNCGTPVKTTEDIFA